MRSACHLDHRDLGETVQQAALISLAMAPGGAQMVTVPSPHWAKRRLGSTPLHRRLTFCGPEGEPRLFAPGRAWQDHLTLALTEIREFGSGDIQVLRRLRALLEDLRQTVLPENRQTVTDEIARLDSTVTAAFGEKPDRDRARTSDPQGIGGPREWRRSA